MKHNKQACDRLCLSNDQFYSKQRLKNQQWFLNGEQIGYGDLRDLDIFRINEFLFPGEVFEAFNEHHMTRFMMRENPTIRITHAAIEFPDFQPVKEETRRAIYLEKGPW